MKIDLEKIAKILEKYDLCEIEYTEDNSSVRVTRKHESFSQTNQPYQSYPVQNIISENTQNSGNGINNSVKTESVDQGNLHSITSPMVGTIYLAPEPGAKPFISVGSNVRKGQVIMIIEAMKVMNQIKSTVDGVVQEILVENGKPVEFGETLVKVKLS